MATDKGRYLQLCRLSRKLHRFSTVAAKAKKKPSSLKLCKSSELQSHKFLSSEITPYLPGIFPETAYYSFQIRCVNKVSSAALCYPVQLPK